MNFLQLRGMNTARNRDLGLLILRILSIALVTHGLSKLTDIEGNAKFFEHQIIVSSAPKFWSVIIGLGQIVLPILLIIGLFTRWSGLLLTLMFVGIGIVETQLAGGFWNERGDGVSFEASLLYIAIGLTLFLTGPGRYSLDHALGVKEPARH
ncbi:MAG: DoxX family protein [Actinomycetaceae bacterium]|nr:DoxX family protein [Arcanobacterium sp.]MDD7505134.1 DoxX family protein [Actinomycetaceae bacterium]MDY6143876.1 DoxX family protein [Arcanobacterium sp.]